MVTGTGSSGGALSKVPTGPVSEGAEVSVGTAALGRTLLLPSPAGHVASNGPCQGLQPPQWHCLVTPGAGQGPGRARASAYPCTSWA